MKTYYQKSRDIKTNFVCEICLREFPASAKDEHHKLMKSAGGSDDKNNICQCDNGCHQTIHRIGNLLASLHQGKLNPDSEATLYARSVNPNHWEAVKSNILNLAIMIAVASRSIRDGTSKVQNSDIILHDIPPEIRKLFMELGKEITNCDGKKIGMSGIILMSSISFLAKQRPDAFDLCHNFLLTRFGLTKKQKIEAKIQNERSKITLNSHKV